MLHLATRRVLLQPTRPLFQWTRPTAAAKAGDDVGVCGDDDDGGGGDDHEDNDGYCSKSNLTWRASSIPESFSNEESSTIGEPDHFSKPPEHLDEGFNL